MTLAELVVWLSSPASGASEHLIAPAVSWHGRMMTLAWAFAIPIAVLFARFFKVVPGQRWPEELDNKSWWHAHRTLNYSAVALTGVAVSLIIGREAYVGPVRMVHAWMGWTIVSLTFVQALSGHLRGSKGGPTAPRVAKDGVVIDLHGDHYDMTARRLVFEWVHKSLGYAVMVLALGATLSGLWTADAPRWMWGAVGGWWILFMVVFSYLQHWGYCMDTYQAIWGPSSEHPGSVVKPVGPGIRRVTVDAQTLTESPHRDASHA